MNSALALAMLLTGAGEVQRPRPPERVVPAPPRMVIPPAPPLLPVPPAPPAPPVLIRAPQTCFLFRAPEGTYDFSPCFNGGDYPLDAWRAGEQGVASVRVTIGANGRPTACEVAVSSGSASLNQTTCTLLRQRILGVDGVAAGTVIGGDVHWIRPEGPPRDDRPDLLTYFSMDDYPAAALRAEEQGTTGVRIDVGEDGRVTNCTVFSSSGSNALDAATCRIIRSRARYRPARDSAGNPVPGVAVARVAWRLPEE